MPLPIADSPPTTIRPFHGPADTVRMMIALCKGPRGEQSTLCHSLKNHIVRNLTEKDYLGEILAVRNYAAEKIRYSNDALAVEQIQDPQRLCEQIVNHGRAVADCDEVALWIATMCRQLGREAEFVIVGFGAPGNYSHVFARVKEPKSGKWIVCDPVAGIDEVGMLRRVTTYQIWEIN